MAGNDFTSQCRLVDGDLVAVQQTRICGHDIAQAQADGVARHQFARRRGDPFSVAFNPGLDRQSGLQGINGVAGLAFFPKPDSRIGYKQQKNDTEVRPVADDAG